MNHTFKNSNPDGFDSDCAVCGGKLRDSVHGATDEIREASVRGKSIYETLEESDWKSMRSPAHMRSYDCFRKGARLAFITFARTSEDWNSPTLYFALEARAGVDSFNRREWKAIAVLGFDSNAPASFREVIATQYLAKGGN